MFFLSKKISKFILFFKIKYFNNYSIDLFDLLVIMKNYEQGKLNSLE